MRSKFSLLGSLLLVSILVNTLGCGSDNSNPAVSSIDIAPISPSVAVGGQVQFSATAHFSDGTQGDITAQANWSSSASNIASIANVGTHPGLATGVAEGKADITVSFAQGSSSVDASTDLTVTKASTTVLQGSREAALVVLSQPGEHMLMLDGRKISVTSSESIALAPGTHIIRTGDGKASFAHRFESGEAVVIELSSHGLLRK
jgi:Big-like domain-containing protein